MKSKKACPAVLLISPLPLAAQAPSIITMAGEPLHHLAPDNDYVNVYNAEAAAGDSLLWHRHNHDAMAIGDQTVTVGIPGKPGVHTKKGDGQVRMQLSGCVHSTRNEGQSAYHAVAIELLRPQTGERNLCATVLPAKPQNCPAVAAKASPPNISIYRNLPRTRRAHPSAPGHQDGDPAKPELIVALDPASITPASGRGQDERLRPGEFLWFDKGSAPRMFKNASTKEVRFIELTFKPSALAKSATAATKPAH
jgi:hypothetical protein